MENTWIKLYRKILDNDALFRSANTFTLWCWILLMVDHKTGILKTGRRSIAMWLKIKPTTVYQSLKRLEKMKMIYLKSDNKVTTITVMNWSSYQSNLSSENPEKSQIRQQSDNAYITRKKIQEYNNISIADTPQLSQKRLAKEKQRAVHRLGYYLEDQLHTSIVNWGKASKAVAMMQKAGYTEEQICWTIRKMKTEEFYQDKGFDLMTVANSIAAYKAAVGRSLRVSQ